MFTPVGVGQTAIPSREPRPGARPRGFRQKATGLNTIDQMVQVTRAGKTFIAFQIAWKLFHANWKLIGEVV